MTSLIHEAVALEAGENAAIVLTNDALHGLYLEHLIQAAKQMSSIRMPQLPSGLEASSVELSVDPHSFHAAFREQDQQIIVRIDPAFDLSFRLHLKDDPAKALSTIRFSVSDLVGNVEIEAPEIQFDSPDFDAVSTVDALPSRASAIEFGGVTEDEVLRVEGGLQMMADRIVSAALGEIGSLDLEMVCAGLALSGRWKAKIVLDTLVVFPGDGTSLVEISDACPETDSLPDLKIEVEQRDSEGRDDKRKWKIDPSRYKSTRQTRDPSTSDGILSIFLPRRILEKRFNKTVPAAAYRESDNGFFGWKLSIDMLFDYFGLSIDKARPGFVIEFRIRIDGSAKANVDIPCVGRKTIGTADFNLKKSTIKVFATAVLQDGIVKFQTSVDDIDLGDIHVEAFIVGRYGYWLGTPAAIFSFLLDYVISRMIERAIPHRLARLIRKQVNSGNIALIDATPLAPVSRYGITDVTMSKDDESLLIGVASVG